MTFAYGPLRLVKGENSWDEIRAVLPALQKAAIARANAIWPGFVFGGMRPDDGEFGIAPIRPVDVYGGGTATWLKNYGSQGSWCNLYSYQVPRDEIHAYAGFSIADATLVFSSIQVTFEDRIYPILEIEEWHMYRDGFAVIIKQDQNEEWVVAQNKQVLVQAFKERNTAYRQTRVIPIGFMLYSTKALAMTKKETSN